MALIKGRNAGGLVSKGFEDLGDLRREAERIVADARVEAERVVGEARAQADRIVAEASPRGFAEGRERGLASGREEGRREGREAAIEEFRARLETLAGEWSTALAKFERDRSDLLQSAREEVIEFALAMGGKVAHRAIEADRTVVRDQVASALALVTDPSRVTISINPGDRKEVKSVLEDLVEQIGRCEHVELRDDDGVSAGGCVVTTGAGRIDATVERQIERIADALLGTKQRGASRASDRAA